MIGRNLQLLKGLNFSSSLSAIFFYNLWHWRNGGTAINTPGISQPKINRIKEPFTYAALFAQRNYFANNLFAYFFQRKIPRIELTYKKQVPYSKSTQAVILSDLSLSDKHVIEVKHRLPEVSLPRPLNLLSNETKNVIKNSESFLGQNSGEFIPIPLPKIEPALKYPLSKRKADFPVTHFFKTIPSQKIGSPATDEKSIGCCVII